MHNLLVRASNQANVVYVRCASCQALVARYELSGYYQHGQGLESYLKAHGVAAGDSGRQWLAEFERTQAEAIAGYEAAVARLEASEIEKTGS